MVSGLSAVGEDAPKIEWRDATNADHEFLRHLMRVTIKETYQQNSGKSDAEVEAHFDLLCQSSWQIVSLDGRDIGGMSVQREFGYAHLRTFHVLPEYQNRGIGSEMLRALIDWAVARRLTLYLEVMVNNESAKRLYERFGFVEIGYIDEERNLRMELPPPPRSPLFPALDFSFLTKFWRRGNA